MSSQTEEVVGDSKRSEGAAVAGKHTPGEWFIHDQYGPNDGGALIAPLGALPVCVIASYYGREAHTANARLIAAAPDMLAAINSILDECDEAPIGPADTAIVAIQRIARAAISKAEGRS